MIVAADLHKVDAVTADEDDHGKLAVKHSHLAVFDVAAVPGDELRYLLNQADLVGSDRG